MQKNVKFANWFKMMNPLHPVRWRKILIGFLLGMAAFLGLALIIVPSPDMSVELELRKQVINYIGDLSKETSD